MWQRTAWLEAETSKPFKLLLFLRSELLRLLLYTLMYFNLTYFILCSMLYGTFQIFLTELDLVKEVNMLMKNTEEYDFYKEKHIPPFNSSEIKIKLSSVKILFSSHI